MNVLPNSGTQLYDVAVFNAQVPKEGPKALPLNVPFTAQDTEFEIQSLLTQAQQWATMLQAVYVDNSSNSEIVEIVTDVLHQSIKIPAGSCAYVPLLSPKNANIVVRSVGAVPVQLIFLNVPVPAAVWSVDNGGGAYVLAVASATTAFGPAGVIGDFLTGLLITPYNLNPGVVEITDGATTITVFAGGTGSVTTLIPFYVPIEAASLNAGWSVTCGANVTALASGRFS